MINFDIIIIEKSNEHNLNWPQVLDHPYIIQIISGSG